MFCQKYKKIGHPTKQGAIIAARRISKIILNVYLCDNCNHWHIGKSKNPYRQVKRIEELLKNHQKQLDRKEL